MKDAYYIAFDIGGTNVKLGVFSDNKLVDSKMFPALSNQNFSSSLDLFANEIEEILQNQNAEKKLAGIGFAFAGLVDTQRKTIIDTNDKYSDSNTIDIESWVYDNWKVPFFIDNDARMAAVGEWQFGGGNETNDLVMITLGTGIGSAAIINGKLLRGKHFQAGCLGGHFVIHVDGKLCNCGNYGCAEAYASSWAINDRIKDDVTYNESILSKIENIGYKELFEAAQKNDFLASKIVEESIGIWSATIVNLIHAYDPEVVVMGGGILGSSDLILPKVRKLVNKRSWTPWGEVAIRDSQLKNSAALFGLNYSLQHSI